MRNESSFKVVSVQKGILTERHSTGGSKKKGHTIGPIVPPSDGRSHELEPIVAPPPDDDEFGV